MLKRGFTLAEVLITLMIIGVVATLTTPALVKNVGSSKIGPQLSKFVNTWETAVETMFMEENAANNLDAVSGDTISSGLFSKLSKYMIMTSLKGITTNNGNYSLVFSDGTKWKDIKYSTNYVWQLKDGTIIVWQNTETLKGATFTQKQGAYTHNAGLLLVDVGGIKGSHRLGKEVFAFMLDNSGILVPVGSNAHKALAPKFTASCSPSSNNASNALACTGAVADNGYKAPW